MDFVLDDEHRMFQRAVHDFVENELKPYAAEIDERQALRWEAIHKMPPLGVTGLHVPEEYGGADMDALSGAIALEEVAWGCVSTGLAIEAHNMLCCAPIVRWGTAEQKARYLPSLTSGKVLGSLALTEPGAGSDLAAVKTRAVRDGNTWVINGNKMWITNADSAPVIVTLVRTDPDADKPSRAFSMIVVETDVPGLTIEPPIPKMGVRGSHAHPITYDNVRVPLDNLLGEEGRGLHQTLETLDGGRIGVGALCVGCAQAALDFALAYVHERETFGEPLASHQAIQFKLADMATMTEASRLMIYKAAWLMDQGKPFTKQATMGKLLASEAAEMASWEALQIHGAYGYSAEFPIERLYRDQRMMSIGEGTSEVMRMVIARRLLAGE
jgi:butyryl-CoA dehydrogenase